MSWFTDLAGKAEALLNQVDQAASESLRDVGLKTPQKTSPNLPPTTTHQDGVSTTLPYEPTAAHTAKPIQGAAVAQVLVGTTPRPSKHQSTAPLHTSTPHKTSSSSVASDDKLFEFLNSPSKPKESVSSRSQTPTTQEVRRHSKSSSIPRNKSSPIFSQPSGNSTKSVDSSVPKISPRNDDEANIKSRKSDKIEASPRSESGPKVIESTDSPDVPVVETVGTDPLDRHTPEPAEQVESDAKQRAAVGDSELSEKKAEVDNLKQTVSNLELENKLLKREISSLNEELASLMRKLGSHDESVAHYESEIHALREQASRTDHMIRQLRSHDDDLRATLESKDSQITVLRARLSEADQKVEEQQRRLTALSTEKERFLQDANLSSTAHSHALESLKSQLQQLRGLLETERESFQSRQQESAVRESRLQAELTQVREELVAQQRQVALTQTRCGELMAGSQRAQQEVQLAMREHDEYKLRAAGILQAKEKLITSLQSGEGVAMGGVTEAKLEDMRLEKEHLTAQLESALQSGESLRAELQECEERHGVEVGRLVEQVRVCEEVLSEERRAHTLTRGELTRLTQELDDTRESLLREKTTTAELVQRNENELTTLKTQLSSTLSPSRAEQESRLHELTESLIQKQTTLETLSAERNSLNLQLQRLQAQLAEAQKSKGQTAVVMSNSEQDSTYRESTNIRPMASVISSLENAPSDSRLHKVKRAVNTLDKFSIRLGVFLRRYPQARLFALLYAVLLHVWVMIVLLTYTPETHDINGPINHQL